MNFFQHPSYKAFSENVKGALAKKSNLLLVSIPGMSVTFYIRKFLEKEGNKNYKYIQSEGENLSKLNILDINFDKNDSALKTSEEYFKKAGLDQKFVLVVNTPYILETDDFHRSLVGGHVYDSYYFNPLDIELIKIFASIIKIPVSQKDIDRIYDLSGGLTRIVKFLLTHKEKLGNSASEILEDRDFRRVFLPTASIIAKCNKDTLLKLGLIDADGFRGEILREYFKKNPYASKINIRVNLDLTFSENGENQGERLLKSEKLILEDAMRNEGVITKEKVADFKWGEGSYDKYSDQAVAKTMMRLKNKLKRYTIIAIPGYGYKIQSK